MSTSKASSIRIAIPSYNQRVFPRFDQAREFHLADVDLSRRECCHLSSHVCAQPSHRICTWLEQLGTHGVICSGIHQHHQLQLQQLGIWLAWGVSGAVEQVIDQWLQEGQLQEPILTPGESVSSLDSPLRIPET